MSLGNLVSKYIASAEYALGEMEVAEKPVNLDVSSIEKVVKFAKAYLDDAKYYRDKKRFEVSLASVAYCEGIIDALKLIGAVKFEWPVKKKRKSER
jgi:FAD synthetase